MKNLEHILQKSIFDYVNKAIPALRPFIFAIPNGGHRCIGTARKLKLEGVTAGVWDVLICLPNNIKHGLFIECKSGKNKLTDSQKEFKKHVEQVGYCFSVCKSIEDFESALCDYFELERLTNKEIFSRIGCENFIQKYSLKNAKKKFGYK